MIGRVSRSSEQIWHWEKRMRTIHDIKIFEFYTTDKPLEGIEFNKVEIIKETKEEPSEGTLEES